MLEIKKKNSIITNKNTKEMTNIRAYISSSYIFIISKIIIKIHLVYTTKVIVFVVTYSGKPTPQVAIT